MIRRMKRVAKLNRRNRRYRWPWGTGVWRLGPIRDAGSFISDEFAEWFAEGERFKSDPLTWPTITFEG